MKNSVVGLFLLLLVFPSALFYCGDYDKRSIFHTVYKLWQNSGKSLEDWNVMAKQEQSQDESPTCTRCLKRVNGELYLDWEIQ